MRGNTPIYFHALMTAPGKDKERNDLLKTAVFEATECDADDQYVDLNITCVVKGDTEGTILSGVPPVRLTFKKN